MKLNNKIVNNSIIFLKKRFAELSGLLLIIVSAIFIFSLSKYSPDSPSFILNSEKLNFNDYFGSLSNAISDIFLQSFGLVSFCIGASILFWGVNLILDKNRLRLLSCITLSRLFVSIADSPHY